MFRNCRKITCAICDSSLPRTDGLQEQKKKFDFGEFLRAIALGGVAGDFTSAGFYEAGKGIERLKAGFRFGKGGRKIRFPENPNDLFPENYAGFLGGSKMVRVLYVGQYKEGGRINTIQWKYFIEWCKTECNEIIVYSKMPYNTICPKFSLYL